jgi:UDP-N-acetylmuramoyl-L-alanyl-D-glutamate--2,6-diaminopimelate ligase
MKIELVFKGILGEGNIPTGHEITGLTIDSRKVKKGFVFFAIKGFHTDGNDYIDKAIESGASIIVTEQEPTKKYSVPVILVSNVEKVSAKCALNFYENPSKDLNVIAITGTNGKTTTAYMLEAILEEAGKTTGVIGTINYRANKNVITPAPNTTPEPVFLNQILSEFKEVDAKNVIMEVSSHALELNRVMGINFDAAIFTNISADHLDFHKTEENYFNSKKKLFELLASKENCKKQKYAIFNGDDKRTHYLKKVVQNRAKTITFGLGSSNDLFATNIKCDINGTSFTLNCPVGQFSVTLKLLGQYNVYNALGALSYAFAVGLDMGSAIRGLEKLENIPGRMQRVDTQKDFYAFVDFAHTTSSLEKAVTQLKKFARSRLITVFGCGGDRDRTKRPEMGKVACANSDMVIITNDNPRTEDEFQIFDDIEKGIKGKFSNYKIVPDRRLAILEAVQNAKKEDIILVAGKGHERGQLVNGKTIPFSDEEEIIKALKEYV